MSLRISTSFVVALMTFGTVFPCGKSRFARAADSDTDDQYVQTINGFVEGRQKLKRGMTRFTCKYRYVIGSSGEKRTVHIRGLYVFDFPERLLRIDAHHRNTDEFGVELKGKFEGYQFADQEDQSLVKLAGDAKPRRLINSKELPDSVSRFDIRVLGVSHAVGWDRVTLNDMAENFERFQDGFTEVQKEDNQIRVTLIAKKDGQPGFRRVIWFREDHDYCPEKLEVSLPKRIAGKPSLVNGEVEWNAPSQTQLMEVIKFKDQWVPKKVFIEDGTDKREFEFQWMSLNEALDPKAFEFDFDPKE